MPEGELAKLRAAVVSAEALADIAQELDLGASLRLGKGEDASGGRAKPSILADAMEAVIAAVYLDGGLEPAARLVLAVLERRIREQATGPGGQDYKTRLQELAAQRCDQLPRYQVRHEGPDHSKRFFAAVSLRERGVRRGRGTFEEGGRAGRRTRCVGTVAGRGEQRLPRPGGPYRGGGCLSFRKSKCSDGTWSERSSARRSRRSTSTACGRCAVTTTASSSPLGWSTARSPRSNGGASTCSCQLDGDDVLVVHLGMSGQLLRAKSSRETTAKHTHVVITFTQGGQLRFVDPRTFGEMFVTESDTVEKEVTELAHLGIDPLETAMSWEHFGSMLAQRHAKLKPLLMDQKFIAGIGNIYSDEILWGAGLRWDRMSDALTSEEVRRLYRSMMETLQEAVKHRGSSLADEQYVDLFGRPGEYQHFHNVYAREGLSCPGAVTTSCANASPGARPSIARPVRSEGRPSARPDDAEAGSECRGPPEAARYDPRRPPPAVPASRADH